MTRREKNQRRLSDDGLNGVDVSLTGAEATVTADVAEKHNAITNPSKVIHITTKVQCLFGVLDASGDVVQRIPFEIDVTKLTPQAFAEVYQMLHAKRGELAEQLAKGG